VQNTDSARHKGYDAGKKVAGSKRHLAVNTQGLPHGLIVTTANVTDRHGATKLLCQQRTELQSIHTSLTDSGYSGTTFAQAVNQWLPHAKVQIVKRLEQATFVVLPKRWIVERTFAWQDKHRRRWKNCECLLNSSLQFAILVLFALLLNRL
jgi:transposase